MNRFETRLPAILVTGAAALLISACGTGQISQSANQQSAVNGNNATIGNVALRDVRLQANQTGDFVEPGRTINLAMVAVNESQDAADRLVDITTDIGTVSIIGDTRLPATGTLFVGVPDGEKVAPGPLDANKAGTVKATVTLTKPITNGLNYNVTFKFENAGHATVMVPISAGLANKEG